MILERGPEPILKVLKVLKSALNFKVGEGSESEEENASQSVRRIESIFDNDNNTNSRATMGA